MAALFSAPVALASDGVLEINQTCAIQTGCFPGDTAGFPVTIATRGSYRLTSSLSYSGSGNVGIQINVANVAVDLSGFTLSCRNVSFPNINPCSDSGNTNGDAINALSTTRGVRIHNGVIQGAGGSAIDIGHGVIEKIQVVQAGDVGIRISLGRVKDCTVEETIGGISLSGQGLVEGNIVSDMAGPSSGIFSAGGTVRNNSVTRAMGTGIFIGANFAGDRGAHVEGNTVQFNTGAGISVSTDGFIQGNFVKQNGEEGIRFLSFGSGLVKDNAILKNGQVGLAGPSSGSVGYRENVIADNAGGTVTGSAAINLFNNVCDGSTVCP